MDRRAFLTRPTAPTPRGRPTPPRHAALAADLAPYAGPWTAAQATHLVRRTHFGASRPDVVAALVAGSPAVAAGAILDAAAQRPLPDEPRWAGSTTSDGGTNIQRFYEWQRAWVAEMAAGGLREKLALLWHDHFATAQAVYSHAAFAVDYLTFLRERAVGPFRPLLEGIGKRPAMLRFLNNDQNRAGDLNENYAREILELFSMGITGPDGAPNYTQDDVVEAARALTGWTVDAPRVRSQFRAERHDAGPKTIFGRTGGWDHDDLVDLIFQERGSAVAHFVAGKLYAWFVHPVANAGVVAALADVLQQTAFDVPAALRALFASAHFYDPAVVGARLKTPMELMVGIGRELGLTPSQAVLETFRETSQSIGQEVLNPPSVEGWPGYDDPLEYRAWVTTGTIVERRGIAEAAVFGDGPFPTYDPLPLVEQVSDRFDPYRLTRDLAAHLLAVPLSEADADALAEQTVLDGVPTSYTRGERQGFWVEIVVSAEDAARDRLRQLLAALVNLPEYQLV
ncbi:DUF1800 domain-containing protein [Rubrivirga sp.]|uniref:DUF1800 domain-containing protein n=1 Tax=Rubrivirga sp. TaxID=1885344 RepID=UPI003B51F33F